MQSSSNNINSDLRIITNSYEKIIINMCNMYTRLYGVPNDIILYRDYTNSDSDSDTSITYTNTTYSYNSDSYDNSDNSNNSDNSDNSDNYSIGSLSSGSSIITDGDSYFRPTRGKDRNRLNIMDIYDNYSQNYDPKGYTTKINKENPIISYLISKRISNCRVGPSSHIAAFLPYNIDIGSCFISGYRQKGRNR